MNRRVERIGNVEQVRIAGDAPPETPAPISLSDHPASCKLCLRATCAGGATILNDGVSAVNTTLLGAATGGLSSLALSTHDVAACHTAIGAGIGFGYQAILSFLKGYCAVYRRGLGYKYAVDLNDPQKPYLNATRALAMRHGGDWVLAYTSWARGADTADVHDLLHAAENINLRQPMALNVIDDLIGTGSSAPGLSNLVAGNNIKGTYLLTHMTAQSNLHSAQRESSVEQAATLQELCRNEPLPNESNPLLLYQEYISEHTPFISCCAF